MASMTEVGDRSRVEPLDAVTTRVRAANPSPMTLSGTNTYLVGAPAAGVVVVDPGPALPAHRRAIDAAVAARGGHITAVVVTHHHADHAAALGWASRWRVPAYAHDPRRVPGAEALDDGARVPADGLTLTVHHHPGHTSDHLCLRVADTGAVLTGDHVLGEGTTVIAWPDGDLRRYLASLEALRRLEPRVLYPGHGDVVADPAARIAALRAHRGQRTRQIAAALADGHDTVDGIVGEVYVDLPAAVRPAAARSVTAHLVDLELEGRAVRREGRWHGV